MKILVADRIAPIAVESLKEQKDFEVIESYGPSPEKLLELVVDVAAIIVRSETQISAAVMDAASNVKAIARAGVGVDNIDLTAATKRGIIVMNAPAGNTIATAELTFSHLLCSARPLVQACHSMKSGEWNRKSFSGSELFRKTLGICGFGRIGSEVAKRAQAFGMHVLCYDPYLTEARAKRLDVKKVEMEELLATSDYITVHVPLTDKTKYLIDEAAFGKMKEGVCVFNCARGGIIKESAMIEALNQGKVKTVGLDVYEQEPLAVDSPLRQFSNVVLTPHLGASTKEAQESVGLEVARGIIDLFQKGIVSNAVNMPSVDAHTLETLVPYLKLGERLGSVLQQITPDAIDKLRITYWGHIIEFDVIPLTRAIQRGYLLNICGDAVNDVNAPHKLKELGIEVEVVKSNNEVDYTELIQVEAISPDNQSFTVSGTLIGKAQRSRIVYINDHDVEVNPEGILLLLENEDRPGIVGMLGTVLGRDSVNIANMSLSRHREGDSALSIYELDSDPSPEVLKEIGSHPGIQKVLLVHA